MVLIVEDEAVSRRALQQLLRLSGLETRAASSAEEAISMVSQGGAPDMALVDINLPGMSGLEFVRQIHRTFPLLPCIFMTANDEAQNEQIRGGGNEPMFRKPFDVPRLIHLIIQTIGKSRVH